MNEKIEDIVIRNQQSFIDITEKVNILINKEDRVKTGIKELERKIERYFSNFTRDNYKDTEKILKLNSLSTELLVYKKLGYDFSIAEHNVILGLQEMICYRVEEALSYFEIYVEENRKTKLSCDVLYLCAMICYNNANFSKAIYYFTKAANLYLVLFGKHDFQSEIYIGECMYLSKSREYPQEKINEYFELIEETLDKLNNSENLDKFYLTLYLKWGNCYFQPGIKLSNNNIGSNNLSNITINNQKALSYYKKIINFIGGFYHKEKLNDLLKVIMVYSLAQAMYSSRKDIDSSFARTNELFKHVFEKLVNLLLNKTETIILAQFYFMLGTCSWYSFEVAADQGLFYLENSRKQTQLIPSNIKFYSCMTKELLTRDEFIMQIDFCINKIKSRMR